MEQAPPKPPAWRCKYGTCLYFPLMSLSILCIPSAALPFLNVAGTWLCSFWLLREEMGKTARPPPAATWGRCRPRCVPSVACRVQATGLPTLGAQPWPP